LKASQPAHYSPPVSRPPTSKEIAQDDEQRLDLQSAGQWHDEDDLRKVTSFPREWLKELRYEGHEVAADERGVPIVRLKSLEFPSG
jgi:hypothetical protein